MQCVYVFYSHFIKTFKVFFFLTITSIFTSLHKIVFYYDVINQEVSSSTHITCIKRHIRVLAKGHRISICLYLYTYFYSHTSTPHTYTCLAPVLYAMCVLFTVIKKIAIVRWKRTGNYTIWQLSLRVSCIWPVNMLFFPPIKITKKELERSPTIRWYSK